MILGDTEHFLQDWKISPFYGLCLFFGHCLENTALALFTLSIAKFDWLSRILVPFPNDPWLAAISCHWSRKAEISTRDPLCLIQEGARYVKAPAERRRQNRILIRWLQSNPPPPGYIIASQDWYCGIDNWRGGIFCIALPIVRLGLRKKRKWTKLLS